MLKTLWILLICICCISCTNYKNTSNNNIISVDIGMEPPTLDPALASDAYSFRVINDLFAGLIDFDQANQPILGMAESFTVSLDNTQYIFHLRDNLKFSDGKAITADDFVYSWQRLVDPKTAAPYSYILNDVVNAQLIIKGQKSPNTLGVKALDKKTFVVNLNAPDIHFLTYLTLPCVFVVPKHIIQKVHKQWTLPKFIVTSGAYKLKSHIINGYIEAQKNIYFYDADNVSIQKIKYFPYTDVNVALANFKTNTLDITWQNVPVDQYATLKEMYPDNLYTILWERIEYIAFNMTLPKFANNLKLRQALSMAIDRELLVNKVLKSGQVPLYSVITPSIEFGKYADLKYSWASLSQAKRNLKAQELFKQAGYDMKHPLKLTLKYKTNDLYKKVALSIAMMWKTVLGVDVILQNQEWKALQQELQQADFDVALAGWGADYNLVDTYLPIYMCNNANNYSHICHSKYDKLVSQAKIASSSVVSKNLYAKAISLMLENYPVIPLFEPSHQRFISDRVKNYNIKTNTLDNVQTKWLQLKTN